VCDDGSHEPVKLRVVDKRKGLDFLIPLSTKKSLSIAIELIDATNRRSKERDRVEVRRKPPKPPKKEGSPK